MPSLTFFFPNLFFLQKVRASVQQLHTALPREEGWLHTFAVKANPTLPSLEVLGGAGVGFEAASVGELTQGTCASPAVSDCNLLTTQLALGCLSRRVNEDQGVRCCTPAICPAQPLHYSGVRNVTARVLDSVLNHFVIILSSSHTHARIHARTHARTHAECKVFALSGCKTARSQNGLGLAATAVMISGYLGPRQQLQSMVRTCAHGLSDGCRPPYHHGNA